ncbi:MAG: hypothetical protein IJ119_10735, partial [Clostridia bacterium]|nr:hypothetical protein [Clostridia bacterium]
SILHFRRGNVPFVLAATFRARLFLFPVDCSLFPLYYPLLFHQQLDKSVFTYQRFPINCKFHWHFPQNVLYCYRSCKQNAKGGTAP